MTDQHAINLLLSTIVLKPNERIQIAKLITDMVNVIQENEDIIEMGDA